MILKACSFLIMTLFKRPALGILLASSFEQRIPNLTTRLDKSTNRAGRTALKGLNGSHGIRGRRRVRDLSVNALRVKLGRWQLVRNGFQ